MRLRLLVLASVTVAVQLQPQSDSVLGRPAAVAAADKALVIRRAIFLPAAAFSSQGQGGRFLDAVTVDLDSRLLMVDVELNFPAGPSWNLAGLVVRLPAQIPTQRHAIGFTAPGQQGSVRFYRRENGAVAIVLDHKVQLLENSPAKPFEIVFSLVALGVRDDNSTWPGGPGTVRLLFQVPKAWKRMQLARVSPPAAAGPER